MPELKVNNRLWIISDTHFGHRNIIKFQQRPESHEAIMLSEWIWAVRENDQILHMGDVFLGKQGNPMRWAAIVSRLPGEKFLMLGNHDRYDEVIYTDLAGFTLVDPFIQNGYAFTHRPVSVEWPAPEGDWHTNIHGHVHGNEHRPEHDGTPLEGKRYINVSVEVTDFKPRQLGNIWRPDTGGI